MFATVEDVFAVLLVVPGGYANARRIGRRAIEIGRSAGRSGRLAHGPTSQIFAARITGGGDQPRPLLPLGGQPDQWRQPQTVDEGDGGTAGVDSADRAAA